MSFTAQYLFTEGHRAFVIREMVQSMKWEEQPI